MTAGYSPRVAATARLTTVDEGLSNRWVRCTSAVENNGNYKKNNGNCSFNQSPTLDICENECLRCNNMVPEQIIHGVLWYFGIFSDYHASKVEQNMFQSDTLLFWMYCEMSPVYPISKWFVLFSTPY